jgi:hypothetical protein
MLIAWSLWRRHLDLESNYLVGDIPAGLGTLAAVGDGT